MSGTGSGGGVQVVAARTGRAVEVAAGTEVEIITQGGSQVVDTWALCLPDTGEYLSVQHTRAILGRLVIREGDRLFSNRRQPMFTLVADTSPGVHDLLIPACDAERYRQMGAVEPHDNCTDNFMAAVGEAGVATQYCPAPLNLFMNVPWDAQGGLTFAEPVGSPGDLVRLRAERDLLLVMSACPQDLIPVNGTAQQPADVHFRL